MTSLRVGIPPADSLFRLIRDLAFDPDELHTLSVIGGTAPPLPKVEGCDHRYYAEMALYIAVFNLWFDGFEPIVSYYNEFKEHLSLDDAMRAAIENGEGKIAKYLLEQGARVDMALAAALENENINGLEILFDLGALYLVSNFFAATCKGKIKSMEFCLRHGAEITDSIIGAAVDYRKVSYELIGVRADEYKVLDPKSGSYRWIDNIHPAAFLPGPLELLIQYGALIPMILKIASMKPNVAAILFLVEKGYATQLMIDEMVANMRPPVD